MINIFQKIVSKIKQRRCKGHDWFYGELYLWKNERICKKCGLIEYQD